MYIFTLGSKNFTQLKELSKVLTYLLEVKGQEYLLKTLQQKYLTMCSFLLLDCSKHFKAAFLLSPVTVLFRLALEWFQSHLLQSVCIFSFFCSIWTSALCFAESCWLFFAQGHGGKSQKKQNYIIAYLEAIRFLGSHPSNVWGVFGAHKERWFCKHCIACSGKFRWANQE